MQFLKSLIPYVLFGLILWYLPEIYLRTHNISDYIFKESTTRLTTRVQVKVVKKIPYLPAKFAILRGGENNLRVELSNSDKGTYISLLTAEGEAVFTEMAFGEYDFRVSTPPLDLTEEDIDLIESRGNSAISESELLRTDIKNVQVMGDTFVVATLE